MAKFKPEEASLEILHFLAEHDGQMVPDVAIAKHIGVPPNIANRLLFDLREDKAPRIKIGEDSEGRSAHCFIGQSFNLPPRKSSEAKDSISEEEGTKIASKAKPSVKKPKKAASPSLPEPLAAKKTNGDMMLSAVNDKISRSPKQKIDKSASISYSDVLSALSERPGSLFSISERLKSDPSIVEPFLEQAVAEDLAKMMDSGVDDSDIFVLKRPVKGETLNDAKRNPETPTLPLDEIDLALVSIIGNGQPSSDVNTIAAEKLGLSKHKIAHRVVTRTNDGLFTQEILNNNYVLKVSEERLKELRGMNAGMTAGENPASNTKNNELPARDFDIQGWLNTFSEEFDVEIPEDNVKGAMSIIFGFVEAIQKENDRLMSVMRNLRSEIDQAL